MFLEVRRADCSEVLDRLMQMVQTILDYSIQTLMQELNFDELSNLVEPEFQYLLKRRSVQKEVEKIFLLPYIERVGICGAFFNDKNFHRHIGDENYQLCQLPEKDSQILKDLCGTLYSATCSGIADSAVHSKGSGNTPKFSVGLLKRQFAEVNGKYGRVCPVCVRELLFDEGEGEADHYFPRKRYPSLILHPYNILPICSDCNSTRLKHMKSPIDEKEEGPGELLRVFLPYLRAAKPELSFSVSEDEKRQIVMQPGPGADSYTESRITNAERLFRLGARWSKVLNHVYDDLMAELTSRCGKSTTIQEWIETLRILLKSNAGSTKDRVDFVKGIYCAWLLTKSDQDLIELIPRPTLEI